jgi:hypothetical protein
VRRRDHHDLVGRGWKQFLNLADEARAARPPIARNPRVHRPAGNSADPEDPKPDLQPRLVERPGAAADTSSAAPLSLAGWRHALMFGSQFVMLFDFSHFVLHGRKTNDKRTRSRSTFLTARGNLTGSGRGEPLLLRVVHLAAYKQRTNKQKTNKKQIS